MPTTQNATSTEHGTVATAKGTVYAQRERSDGRVKYWPGMTADGRPKGRAFYASAEVAATFTPR